jgi:signal transduction histidine kinase
MTLVELLIIFFGILNLSFGAFLYLNSKGSLVVKLYSFIIVFATLWSLFTLFTAGDIIPRQYYIFAVYGHYVFGYLAYLSFFWFAILYPVRPRRSVLAAAGALTALTLCYLLIIPTSFFATIVPGATLADSIVFGNGYVGFVLMLSGVFFTGLLILLRTQHTFEQGVLYKDLDKYQIYFALLANFIAGVLGIVFNLIFPLYGNFSFFYINPILVTGALVSIGLYNILRYNLFNSRIVLAEFFTGGILILALTRFLLAPSGTEKILDGILLAVMLAFGAFLMQSIFREERMRNELQRLNDEKSEFMTFASHEIRNPITAMRGFASLIADGTTGQVAPATKDAAEKILVTGNEVLMLIAQFLSKSKLELGKIEYLVTPFDIACAVSSIADGYQPHAKQKGLTLVKHIDTSTKVMVKGDEGKLKEVVANLFDNALKYTRQGSITASVRSDSKRARVVIEDTGVGIPHETLPQLFKKFTRADAQKVNLLGTGIGLFLAKTFIEGQGGRIWAESAGKDKGSRFIIELPLQ